MTHYVIFYFSAPLATKLLSYEAVGRFYEAAVKRQRADKSFSAFEEEEAQEQKSEKEEKLKELTSSEKQYLLTLDAAEWKVSDVF